MGVVLHLVVDEDSPSAAWSVWTGRRAAGVACLASICRLWGVGLCCDVVSSALAGICSLVILAMRLRHGRGGAFHCRAVGMGRRMKLVRKGRLAIIAVYLLLEAHANLGLDFPGA
eukprot:1145883-Pelagomonas_calceolata.AAC.1